MKLYGYILLFAAAALLSGCRKKLCYEESHPHQISFRVIVDYSRMDYTPEEMQVDFYSIETGQRFVRFVTPTNDHVHLPGGQSYRAVISNHDSEYIEFSNGDLYEQYNALLPDLTRTRYNGIYSGRSLPYSQYTQSQASHEVDVQEEQTYSNSMPNITRSIGQPDLLFVDHVASFAVVSDASQPQPDMHVAPINTTKLYKARVKIVGMQYVSRIRGTFTGVAPALYLHNQQRVFANNVGVMFDCSKDGSYADCRFTAFGLIQGNPQDPAIHAVNYLAIEFLLVDGTIYTATFDVTNRLTEEICCEGGSIFMDDLEVNIPETHTDQSGGFEANVDEWGPEIEVPLQ